MLCGFPNADIIISIVKGAQAFCQRIDDAITTIPVIALPYANAGKIFATTGTSADRDVLLVVLFNPFFECNLASTFWAMPCTLLHGVHTDASLFEGYLTKLLNSVFCQGLFADAWAIIGLTIVWM